MDGQAGRGACLLMAFSMLILSIIAIPGMVMSQGIGPITLMNVELVTVDEDSAAITWVTNLASDTKVEWGTTSDLGQENRVDETTNYHMGRVQGLQPGTLYYYRVGSGGSWTDIASFTTLKGTGGALKIKFVIVADPHYDVDGTNNANGAMYEDSVRLLRSFVSEVNGLGGLSFVVATGDLTNGAQADYEGFGRSMDDLNMPWYPVLGNWDKNTVGWEGWYTSATGRDRSYYSVDTSGYHIVVLDTAVPGQVEGGLDDEQLQWLEKDLDANEKTPTLVFMHHMADRTDIFGIDPASKERLDGILSTRPNVFSITAGHIHQNIVSTIGKRLYVTTAATVEYPVGYSVVRLYSDGYTQSFSKIESELATSEESRMRKVATNGADQDDECLGDLEDRSFVAKMPRNQPPLVSQAKVDPMTAYIGETVTVSVTASDPDGDRMTYGYTVSDGYIEGTGPSVEWHPPDAAGTYSVTVTVSDYEYVSNPVSAELTVKERPVDGNDPPVIRSVKIAETRIETGQRTSIEVDAYDPDEDALSYEYDVTGGAIEGTGSKVTYKAPSFPGTYKISITVDDGELTSDTYAMEVTVWEPEINHRPEILRVTTGTSNARTGDPVQIDVVAIDEDGDDLIYYYRPSDGMISGSGKRVQWTAPEHADIHTIEVWVSDGELESDKEKVSITVSPPPKEKDEDKAFIPGFGGALPFVALTLVLILTSRRR